MTTGVREDDLVARIRDIVDGRAGRSVRVGIGDDAAVWQPSRSHRSVISTDMAVEGVHFTRRTMSLEDAGWRLTAANLSDLAAMGARPVLATVALGVPRGIDADDVVRLYRGIGECASRYGLAIVGGDLSVAPATIAAMTVVGEVRTSNCKTRTGARAGDVLAVTGPLGSSRAGLDVATGSATLAGKAREDALSAYRRPQPRVREGEWLGAREHVRAMIDCSDGLSTDVARLCASSGLGAILENVPVADAARAIAEQRAQDAREYALGAGEDYELIVACDKRAFSHVAARFHAHFGTELLRVGATRDRHGVFAIDPKEKERPVPRTGWDHFSSEAEPLRRASHSL